MTWNELVQMWRDHLVPPTPSLRGWTHYPRATRAQRKLRAFQRVTKFSAFTGKHPLLTAWEGGARARLNEQQTRGH